MYVSFIYHCPEVVKLVIENTCWFIHIVNKHWAQSSCIVLGNETNKFYSSLGMRPEGTRTTLCRYLFSLYLEITDPMLNKIVANLIQHHKKWIIYHTQIEFIPKCKAALTSQHQLMSHVILIEWRTKAINLLSRGRKSLSQDLCLPILSW